MPSLGKGRFFLTYSILKKCSWEVEGRLDQEKNDAIRVLHVLMRVLCVCSYANLSSHGHLHIFSTGPGA